MPVALLEPETVLEAVSVALLEPVADWLWVPVELGERVLDGVGCTHVTPTVSCL